jgi:hypothetical protein
MSNRGKLTEQLFGGRDPLKNIVVKSDTGAPTADAKAPFVYNSYDDDWYIYSVTSSDYVKVYG